jgi:hypothetical protein
MIFLKLFCFFLLLKLFNLGINDLLNEFKYSVCFFLLKATALLRV